MATSKELAKDPFSDVEPARHEQAERVSALILKYEPAVEPFEHDPADVDLTQFEQLTAPTQYDENTAPAAILRSPDGRILWLSVFRNPDTNKAVRYSATVVDAPHSPGERQTYGYYIDQRGFLADRRLATSNEAVELEHLIEVSEQFNPFD